MSLLSWLGLDGTPTTTPAGGGGLLSYLAPGAGAQAGYAALGQLGGGLLAAGAPSYDPGNSGRMIGQAVGGFAPAYQHGLQTAAQQQLMGQDLQAETTWQRAFGPNANLQDPAVQAIRSTVPASLLPYAPVLGRTAFQALAGRTALNGPVAPAQAQAELGANYDSRVSYQRVDGHLQRVDTPSAHEADTMATTRVTGIQRPGQGGGIEWPFGQAQMSGGAPMPAVSPPGGARSVVGAVPAPMPGPGVGGARPQMAPGPQQRQRMIELGIDPDAYVGGPNDPYRTAGAPAPGQMPPTGRAVDPNASSNPGSRRVVRPDGSIAIESVLPPASSQPGQREGREGTLAADETHALATEAVTAARQVPLVQRQLQMLDRGLQSGSLADTRSALAGAIRTMAPDGPGPLRAFADAIMNPDEAAFRAAAGELVLARAGGSLGPGVSNSDAIRFDQLVPNIRNDPAAAREVAQILLRTSIANARDAHEAYASSSQNYDPRTDPTTNRLRIMGRRNGIDFLTPDTVNPQQGPPQAGMTRAAPPVSPPLATSPPIGATAAGTAIPGPAGTVGRAQPMPQPPAQASTAPGQQPRPQVQITPMLQRDGRNVINEGSLVDQQVYSGGILGPGRFRFNQRTRDFTRLD